MFGVALLFFMLLVVLQKPLLRWVIKKSAD